MECKASTLLFDLIVFGFMIIVLAAVLTNGDHKDHKTLITKKV